MIEKHTSRNLLLVSALLVMLVIVSCKKDKSSNSTITPVPAIATPTKLGLYESDSSIYKLLYIAVSKVGTSTIDPSSGDAALVFDTGSGGMVLDATGILPKSMITSNGFNFTGDSTVVNGITITSQTQIVEYGDDSSSLDKVYGNLAYADVTIGDENGSIVVKRLPFFIYYKAVDSKGRSYPAYEFNVFGVSPEYDVSFNNNAYITSPFSYYTPGNGLTNGMKMAVLGTSHFSLDGTYVPNVVTLGLTAADLSSSSGFSMSQLTYYAGDGYAPIVPGTVTYGSKSVSAQMIFDTGTEPYSYIMDKNASSALTLLPNNTSVTVSTTSGFTYPYSTSSTENLTYIENPTLTGGQVTIISLEFFLTNEYMLDYTNHKLGVKLN